MGNQPTTKRSYDNPTTVNILKALFESENCGFSSFSSIDHGAIVKKTIENSRRQEQIKTVQLNGDPILHEFINYLYTIFSNTSSTNNGMVKYEIHSIQSLSTLSSTTIDNQSKSIYLPKSMTSNEAHRILSTILYSNNNDTIPVDLADYVLVYENIMIPLENHDKELYEQILKISFRLNRIALPPFQLLIIHRSHLLLLERKESKPLLPENKSISILQLIMCHLLTPNDENWPINEIKMGIIPSSQLIHPLKYNKLRESIANIIQTNNLLIRINVTFETCLPLLEKIFADITPIHAMLPSLSKLIQVYDYPLLIALPYDRLFLSQFRKIQSAQGIMANGKYYSVSENSRILMSELRINRGSIIQLKFNIQSDTIVKRKTLSSQMNEVEVNDCFVEVPCVIKDKLTSIIYRYSAGFDNNTIRLMFTSEAIHSIISNYAVLNKNVRSYLKSKLQSSNNWITSSTKFDELKKQIDRFTAQRLTNTFQFEQAMQTSFSSSILINNPSTSSLQSITKPECLNCLSHLNEDNLECPYCTKVFCRICIENNYDRETRNHYCPKCYEQMELSAFKKLTIIGKFIKQGTSAFKCLKCNSIPAHHRLCSDPKCSAIFCDSCCKPSNQHASSTTEIFNPSEKIPCSQCKTTDTYVSGAVSYYIRRITEYQIAQGLEASSAASPIITSLPNTVWKKEDYLPEKGTLEENYNRIISVIQFNDDHIQFDNREEHCPLLIIKEPPEYTCLESLRLSYWNTNNEINRWEDDKNVRFHEHSGNSIAAYIPHFSNFTVRNNRLTEHVMLDTAFLDATYDYDFTAINDVGKTFQRGLEPYIRPCGWYRKGIKVLGKYENESWLKMDGNGWPVAYHGTTSANALSVLRNGLIAGGSNGARGSNSTADDSGIYLSPNPLSSSHPRYSKPFEIDGRRYQIMFQVRVKPDSIIKHDPNIWRCINSQDVRPYGILLRETSI